ncbi:hypothetical protein [Acinetobacter sp.]|uniref:hypothetical protein n=1 Tax=Acinetobacter sp. TaxID=472 RepID=UPI003BB097D8
MEILEVFLINLFMLGENFSNHNNQQIRDTTIIECEGFKFQFKQLNIQLKQSEFINQSLMTTKITVENIGSDKVELLLNIVDNFCSLLSFAQQAPVRRCGYKLGSEEHWTNCSAYILNPFAPIIKNAGKEIRNFIEQAYPTFKKFKSSRQLTVVFGYLCEANRSTLTLELALISHYIAIENLKNSFAIEQGYKYKDGKYSHPLYPPQDYYCKNKEEYCFDEMTAKYIHKLYSKCGSTEMTKRMFVSARFKRAEISPFLNKRNKIIHEGILLPFGDENYMEQAIKDCKNVSDLLRKYLLTLLNYKGAYYLSRDRIGPSGPIT